MTDTRAPHPFELPVKAPSKQRLSAGKPSEVQLEKKRVRDRIAAIEEKQEWDALWGKDAF